MSIHQEEHIAMSPICEFIRNLLHPKDPGFFRRIISKFCGLLLNPFKRQKDKAAMSTNLSDDCEHPELLGFLHEADHNEGRHYEPSAYLAMEQQKVTKEEELESPTVDSLIKTEMNTDEIKDGDNYIYCRYCRKSGEHYTDVCPNKSKNRVMVCALCSDSYPCANQKEHGEKGIEVTKYCDYCSIPGHWTQDCEEDYIPYLEIMG